MNENKMNQPLKKTVEQLRREQAERRLDLILTAIEDANKRIDENPEYVSMDEITGLETELLEVMDELGLNKNTLDENKVETVENNNKNNSMQQEWFEKFETVLDGMIYLTEDDKKSLREEYLSETEGGPEKIVKGVNGTLGLKALKLNRERKAE